ncbi:MAG: hypothetical protein RBT63_03150 [Bdellovibrionales bacterium]|jgi:hypothetical protein|nr:hypothetical protein [Bdellovibrionales bacterium]
MKQKALWCGFIYLILSAATLAQASNAHGGEIERFYRGVRSLGMGGVYVNTVNDETAILTNPAGLGKLRDTTWTLVDPELHGAFTNTDIVNYTNIFDAVSAQGLLDRLNQARGKNWHARLQMFPSVVTTNFGIGLLAKYDYNARVDENGTNYRLDYVNDWALALAYNFRFLSGVLKVGVTGRIVNRSEVHADLDPNSTGLEMRSLEAEGLGVAGDVGAILTAPVAGLPSLGVTVRDVGTTSYNLRPGLFNVTTARPRDTLQSVDVGLSVQPIMANRMRTTFAIEYHGVTTPLDPDHEDFLKRTHVGMELNAADFFFLRAGANQGYWTAGAEFATERFQLQLASYGEELGSPTARIEDRRWVAKFSLRF